MRGDEWSGARALLSPPLGPVLTLPVWVLG